MNAAKTQEDTGIPFDRPTIEPVVSNRARGAASLSVRLRDHATVLRDLRQSGSAKVLFPRTASHNLQAVWLNTAGGVTGGDHFTFDAEVDAGAGLTVTTQAAERIYRAPPGAPGQVANRIVAGDRGRVDWLPQETILFDASALDRRLRIDMAASARVLACETLVFGREAMGEDVHTLALRDRIDLFVDGDLRFADRLHLTGDASAVLARRATANGARAVASVLLAAPDAAQTVDALRQILPENAGVSAPDRSIVFLRIVAADSFEMRKYLIPVLRHLTGADLPRPWTL